MFMISFHPFVNNSDSSSSSNLLLGLNGGEALDAVLHQHRVELGHIPLPLEGEPCCHLQELQDNDMLHLLHIDTFVIFVTFVTFVTFGYIVKHADTHPFT